ncbi:MAG: hypothetical protein K0M70_14685 [Arenimonas sp.]|uniref:DUF6491 family protein n=1 Tax=Arenimonas sp. TaxID=1872635 RepID=UPI0025BF29A7|nr:DUF6491 family protein [Arenimonas sp.]MBW8369091.1 hypothetical protein [Arenimonas sp.]
MALRLAFLMIGATVGMALAAPALAINDAADDAKDAIRLEAARANAGEPVKTVRFLRAVDSYEVVGGTAVLVWETNTKAWLVDLRSSASCRPRDLDSGWAIGLESAYDTMNTSNGYVVGRDSMRCKITQIREVDVPAMRAAERSAQVAAKD